MEHRIGNLYRCKGWMHGLLVVTCVLHCGSAQATDTEASPAAALFTDVSQSAGLDFIHFNGMTGELYFPEMTGAGGAVFDYDNDGDLDLYLLQGTMLGPDETLEDALFAPQNTPPRDRLYRNDTVPGQALRFTDVTDLSGLTELGYGMGVATGDYDNDGWVDLYVTNYGENHMLHNNGNGTFADVTVATGTADNRWSTSAAFFDYDQDGWLDLYVVNYVEFSTHHNPVCYANSSRRDYCGPAGYTPQADRLFQNRGDGSFEEVTQKVLGAYRPGPGLGVVSADFNGDGWIDLYVANDGASNQLWLNQNGNNFIEDALFAGAAVNMDGVAEASMGVDAGDFDGDGDEDIFITHLAGETNTLYRNDGSGTFDDDTQATGLGAKSLPYTGFGTAWLDFDNDGWLDLLSLNGAVSIIEAQAQAGELHPLRQPNQLFHNLSGQDFVEIRGASAVAFAASEVSRGAALGDLDNDGDMDVVVFNNNGPARLLRNNSSGTSWLGLRLIDKQRRRDLTGTRVEVVLPDRPPVWRRARNDGSYCSANDPRILIGLGDGAAPTEVRILWPDGDIEVWGDPKLNTYTTLHQGWSRTRSN